MTDNEIIRALECKTHKNCERCTYLNEICTNLELVRAEHILDLINRQKAEIERLEKDSKRLKKVQMQLDDATKMYTTIKVEAIKEFADELIKRCSIEVDGYYGEVVWTDDIDDLVKEMVGDS